MNYYLLLALIVLIILSSLFSATETAFTGASIIKLKSMTDENKRAKKVLDLCNNFDKLITTILIGNNIVNLTAASISTIFFIDILQGTGIDGTTFSTIVTTVAVLIFGEITPKFIAKTYPEKTAVSLYPFITFFSYLFLPLNYLFTAYKKLLAKVFKLKADDIITEEQIMTIVEEAEEDGTLKKEETNLIRSVIEFDDLEVGDILIPRVNITAIDCDSSLEEIKAVFSDSGYSRIPVYKDTIDTVIGTILEKDLYLLLDKKQQDVASIIQKPYFTTEHVKISKLLKSMQKRRNHMAIVLDEYGGTLGLVTIEDILEELVGEIYDEFDEEINYFKKVDEKTVIVDATCPLSDMLEYFNIEDDDKYTSDTVSGYVIAECGDIPKAGKKLALENLDITVTKSTNKRVLEIKVTINPKK